MNTSYRTAGRAAIASGVIGILGIGSLLGYLTTFGQDAQNVVVLQKLHDAFLILQLVFLIPVVIAFCKIMHGHSSYMLKTLLNFGIGALCFTILFLLLALPKILKDFLFMFPQGVFGVWLIIACWRLKGLIPQWIRWFGIIVGLGLTLVGIFPLGYALFVDKIILHIPAPSDEMMEKIPSDTPANIFLHQILWIGSLMGMLTLPIWTILIGIRLLRINLVKQMRN